jgi:hypothetical protein
LAFPQLIRFFGAKVEDVILPLSHIQKQTLRFKRASIPLVLRFPNQIAQLPLLPLQIRERQPNKTLAEMIGIVHGD